MDAKGTTIVFAVNQRSASDARIIDNISRIPGARHTLLRDDSGILSLQIGTGDAAPLSIENTRGGDSLVLDDYGEWGDSMAQCTTLDNLTL
ncbi:MAG: hypothetical protein IJS15_03335 [Victivallales bacterium]|nr:hypothetical protein [Victivallales bacterium]